MANGIDIEIPCPELPKIPKVPSINVLGMAELKGLMDFSVGTPRDCTLSISLMLQLAPMLASMTCLLRILAVIEALEKAIGPPPDPTELVEKIGELLECFGALLPFNIAITIKAILELIINFLSCFLEQLDSLVQFQAGIDLSAGEGNPVLQASLECALDNSQASMDNLMLSLESIQPLLSISTSLAGVAGFPLELPDTSKLSENKDNVEVVADLNKTVQKLKDAINSLPL